MLIFLSSLDSSEARNKVEHLYHKCHKRLWLMVYEHQHHAAKAEDIVQETFLRFTKHPEYYTNVDYDDMTRILFTIAKNLQLDAAKRDGLISFVSLDDEDSDNGHSYNGVQHDFAKGSEPAEILITNERYEQVLSHIKSLQEPSATIFRLKYIMGHTDKEIAATLSITEENVRVRISRARKTLLKLLEREQADV